MSESTTTVRHQAAKNRFEIDLQGQTALLDYERRGDVVDFNHTEVPPEFEGRGIGAQLVKAGLDWARSEDARVIPSCPFVAAYIRRHPEWASIVAADWQSKVKR